MKRIYDLRAPYLRQSAMLAERDAVVTQESAPKPQKPKKSPPVDDTPIYSGAVFGALVGYWAS